MRFTPSPRNLVAAALAITLAGPAPAVLAACPGIAAGDEHSVAVASNGRAWAWGDNSFGQVGNGTSCTPWPCGSVVPEQVRDPAGTGFLTDVVAVAAGDCHSLALKGDGTVWSWGCNQYGSLGDGTTRVQATLPRQVRNAAGTGFLAGIAAIAAAGWHSLALHSDGTVWAWGNNEWGQLGNGSVTGSFNLPVQVRDTNGTGFLTGILRIATGAVTGSSEGAGHTLALRDDGTFWAWGANQKGELGNGTTCTPFPCGSNLPVQVRDASGAGFLTGVLAFDAGGGHSMAVTDNGSLWAWGNNRWGGLGDGTWVDASLPVRVRDSAGSGYFAGTVMVAGGSLHSFAAKGDGSLWAWGYNYHGQLGDGSDVTRALPAPVKILRDVTSAAGSIEHSLALLPDGSVWAWGWNRTGQLGIGTTVDEYLPTRSAVDLGPGVPADQGNTLRAAKQVADVVLTWTGSGASSWAIYRDPAKEQLGSSWLSPSVSIPSFTDRGRVPVGGLDFYRLKGLSACGTGP